MKSIKEIVIFFFSGTGNSKQISIWFADYVIKKDIKCTVYNIADIDINSIQIKNPETLIIVVSPVHGFNYPNITIQFIKNFPKGKNPVVLMTTRAGLKLWKLHIPGISGISFLLASIILKIKGYKIIGQIPFDMPSTWLSFHPALRGKAIKFMFNRNLKKVEKHAEKILINRSDFIAYRDILQDILVSPIAIGYYIYVRFFLAKTLYASKKCNNCDLCIKQCPVQAIEKINSRPFWKLKCESCMKCINSCPQRAIETAHGIVLISIILANTLMDLLTNYYQFHWVIKLSFYSLICFALLLILYKFQNIILNNRIIEKLISYTSLTHYKFWGRYNIDSESDNINNHNNKTQQ
jgi:ferredoxin/flavodoxin